MSDNIIEVKNLTRKFGKITAVDDITFDVKSGEVFGFLGPNGAGKTTTINIICTLLHPDSGKVQVCGFDVYKDKMKIRDSIGLVFQDPSLDDRLTAMENLNFHSLLYNVPRDKVRERIDEVLKMVDLQARNNELVRNYSGGMRRRLEIARGLIHYPKILFLDEPTIGLDPQTRNKIWDYLMKLKQKEDITIFLTTHYMEESEICDRIAIIDMGKIIALDTPDRLKAQAGCDVITLKSKDNDALVKYLKENFGSKIERKDDILKLEVKKSASMVPAIIKKSPVDILEISARKSTLNDVFLNLTGREIREETASGKDSLKLRMRARMRR